MGLDVSVIRRKDLVCSKCGEVVGTSSMDDVDSGGRVWYPFLEAIGYYVPYDKRTEENDWYGKDMVLNKEQVTQVRKFVKCFEVYNHKAISNLIAAAECDGDDVVINADW